MIYGLAPVQWVGIGVLIWIGLVVCFWGLVYVGTRKPTPRSRHLSLVPDYPRQEEARIRRVSDYERLPPGAIIECKTYDEAKAHVKAIRDRQWREMFQPFADEDDFARPFDQERD